MAIVAATAVVPAASAQTAPITDEKEVTFTCLGVDAGNSVVSPTTFTATFPEEVAPGEIFTVSVQPGQMRNNTRVINRLTLDYALPANAAILDLKLGGGDAGLGGAARSAVRVNSQTKLSDPNGTVARIWGGASARFGTSPSINSTGGTTVAQNTNFRLPKLDITLRAPAQPGAAMTIGLPGANEEHAGDGTAASTDLQWVRSSSPWGPAQCSSGPEAATLTTTTVGDLDPVLLPSTTTLTSSVNKLGPSQPTTFTAKVTTQYGALAQLPQGRVEFRDADTDEVLGTAAPNASGAATLDYTFPAIAPGQPDQARHVLALYTGVDRDVAASTSAPITVTNTAEPTVFNNIRFDSFRAQLGQETAADVAVSVTTNVNKPSGPIPDQAKVQLFRDGVPFGDPVALPTGNELVWNDVVERQPRTTTHRYHAEFASFTDGYQQWGAAVSPDVTVTVTGSDPSLDPPITGGGDTGSLGSLAGLSSGFGS
ncbi:MAG: Ig-like domain-containing protein [Nocardiaceae bacterium]|nr:Ig-like domain-containing protein [Nocardiaceae bacterium]